MEKKALAATLRVLRVIYTIHSTGPAKLRLRLGYRPVGRWIVYLPKVGSAYFHALLKRGCSALSLKVPAAMLAVLAAVTGRLHSAVAWLGRQPKDFEVAEISDITVVAQEYERFWNRARQQYDLTIDRSLDFLRWRVVDNRHLHFRTWALRRQGGLGGHRHRSSAPSGRRFALYIDDIIVGEYGDASFAAVLSSLPDLDPSADATVVMTLAVDTPLYRVLRRRFRLQSLLLDRFGHALFDEMVAMLDKDGVAGDGPWYVTPIFTEGMDTSRNEQADSGTPAWWTHVSAAATSASLTRVDGAVPWAYPSRLRASNEMTAETITGSLAGAQFVFRCDAPDLCNYARVHLAPLQSLSANTPTVTSTVRWHDSQPPHEAPLPSSELPLERVDRDVYASAAGLWWFRVDDLRDLYLQFSWKAERLAVEGDFYYRLGNSWLTDHIRRLRHWPRRGVSTGGGALRRC